MGNCIRAAANRTRLEGGPQRRDRISLGRGPCEHFPEIMAEFVRLKVDVVVTTGSAVPAFKQATSVIPIVFAIANDPVGGGLVDSLARPGGNVTGLSILAADLGGKRLEILREFIPSLSRLATIGDMTNWSPLQRRAKFRRRLER